MKVITLVALTVPVVINFTSIIITNVNIHNNYSAPINYAVDSSPTEAVEQFTNVKTWMEENKLTEGNSCVFIKSNPNCDLGNYYNNRILLSIAESSTVDTNNTTAVSNLSLKLNERFIGKGSEGSEYTKMPINYNLYLRWKDMLLVGWFVDLYCWIYLVGIWFFVAMLSN